MTTKINTSIVTIVILIGLMFSGLCALGQFEQKLTINGSGTFIYPDMLEEYTQYGDGVGVDGGVQFNFNRRLSLYGSVRFYYMFGGDFVEAYYDNLAFGGGLKLNLLPAKKINPYLFGEANLNFIWWDEWLILAGGEGVYNSDFATTIGGLGGLGIDYMLNDNFTIFLQSGPYYTIYDTRTNLYTQLGIRINMIKSKTI